MKANGKTRTFISFDWAMKRLLRNKVNFEVLEGFLNELLKYQIKIEQILESESNQETYRDKFNKVDILVENEKKELMIIELQYTREFDYFHRMLYGTSRIIIDNLFKGDEYVNVKKVYSINIAYFDLSDGHDYVYHGKTHFKGVHINDELQLSKLQRERFGKIEVGDLHPEYYILKVNHFDDVAKDTLDEWIYYLKNNKIKDDFKAQGLDKARKILDYDLLSPAEKRSYDKDLDAMLGEASAIYTAKEEGKEEERRKIALNCFRSGLMPEAISSITGLSKEEIQLIIQQNETIS